MDIKKYIKNKLQLSNACVAHADGFLNEGSSTALSCVEIAIDRLQDAKKALEIYFENVGGQDE